MHPSTRGARISCSAASIPLSRLFLSCVILLALVLQAVPASARRGEAPLSPVGRGSIGEPTLRVAAPDVSLLESEDQALRDDGQKTLRYAEPIAVSVSPATDGRWEVLSDGLRVWRMEVEGPGATDINLGFTTFEVPYGGKLWVISTEADYYEGPYTHEDNKEHGELWVPLVPGSRAIVELQLPAETKFEPRIEMTHVGYGYIDVFSMNGLPKQGSCNNDVICPEGDPWRDQIKSVATYSLGGSLFCSGQMVMDADATFRPYFLTAYHCGLTASNAASLVVFWNFESPTCGALSGGSLSDNQTGAVFRTRRQDVDMCLVELDDFPDPTSEVFYTGWDRSGDVPQGSVGIHHPNTDEKAISFNDDALTTAGSCISSSSNTHWFVDDWEDGTTEPGSSGSGLWDPATKLLVGFLSGGLASCTVIDYDCYGKFSVAWDGTSSSTRLRDWLDPSGTGALQVEGSFPSGDGVLVFASVNATDECQGASDGVIEPGETVMISLSARAVLSDVIGISGTLVSSTPGVTIVQGSANWPDILVGTTVASTTPFEVLLDASVACYSDVQFVATLTDGLGNEFTMPFSLSVGQVQSPAGLPLAIPDANPSGVISSFTVAEDVSLTDLNVRVQIEHTWVGDLRIQLRSPAGTLITLLDRPGVPATTYGCSDNDLDIVFDDSAAQALESYCAGSSPWYSGTALPTQALSAFNGQSTAGTWQLIVADFAGSDTGSIIDWQLLTTPGISQGICEPCEPLAEATTLQASSLAAQRVSIVVVPDGSGDRLDDAQLWDGVPGSSPTRVDATVRVRVETATGDPVPGFAAADLVLGSTEGNLALCAGAGVADADTDTNGETTVSGALAAGGSSNVGGNELMTVTGTGLNTVYAAGSGLELTFNSPDLNGDGVVDLIDVGTFAPIFAGGVYDYAADFAWDGVVNLGDLGVFSTSLGAACAAPLAKQAPLPVASGALGISFDAAGTVTTASLAAQQELEAFVILRGDVGRSGILGWEAALRTSDNVRVIATEVVAGSLDVHGQGAFAVGTTGAVLRSSTGVLVLAKVRLTVTDDAAAFLYLDPRPAASGAAESPVVLVPGDASATLAALTRTEAPVATLNDPLGGAPGAGVVTKVSLTNVPNPFNPSTEIKFALVQTGRVEIRVYDVSGRLVRRFDLGEVQAGEHATVWRGEDQNGREVVSGVYFSKLYIDGVAAGASRKMSLLK